VPPLGDRDPPRARRASTPLLVGPPRRRELAVGEPTGGGPLAGGDGRPPPPHPAPSPRCSRGEDPPRARGRLSPGAPPRRLAARGALGRRGVRAWRRRHRLGALPAQLGRGVGALARRRDDPPHAASPCTDDRRRRRRRRRAPPLRPPRDGG